MSRRDPYAALVQHIARETHAMGIPDTLTPAERVTAICGRLRAAEALIDATAQALQALREEVT